MDGLLLLDKAAIQRTIRATGSNLDLLLFLAEWLAHLNLFSDAQIYDILKFVKSGIEEFAIAADAGKSKPTTLCVCDSQWVSFSGLPNFLDTQLTEEIPELPSRGLTHIFCDLEALRERMKQRQGRQAHANAGNGNQVAPPIPQASEFQPAQ